MNIMDKLANRAKIVGPVCVGLDTKLEFIPKCISETNGTAGEHIFEFNKRIVDATKDTACCYKLQIACYEALGLDGLRAFSDTLKYIRSNGLIAISDIKRGDISSTAAQYAKGHFCGDFETDIITVNGYMGVDAISPYTPYFEIGKGMFALVKTSNPSSVDLQDTLESDGRPVYMHMAELVSKWGSGYTENGGFSAIGAVVGLTYPDEFIKIKAVMPNTFFLIPGYGAQGGTGKDLARIFGGGICGVVNSSRGIIAAHKGKTEGDDFVSYIACAAEAMREDIMKWLL